MLWYLVNMARVADPAMRTALIETAARILATEGPSRLTLRHLADQVDTSTMAIYTHFGGMDQLRLAVCIEGFRRLAAHLGGVGQSDDPVADLVALGVAYTTNARQNPHLYRAMFLDRLPVAAPVDVGFGLPPGADNAAVLSGSDLPGDGDVVGGGGWTDRSAAGGRAGTDGDELGSQGTGAGDASDEIAAELMIESAATFEVLVTVTARCVAAGRFRDDANPRVLAGQLWGTTHGLVTLELAGLVDPGHTDVLLGVTSRNLAVAFGDDPDALDASVRRALADLAA